MASEFITAGIKFCYAAETTANTMPTTGYTQIPGVKGIPAIDSAPNMQQVTDLSDTNFHRYIAGLKSLDALEIQANLTSEFKTAWEGAVTAYAALTGGKGMWFEVKIPGFDSFYFRGQPVTLGFAGSEVDAVQEASGYIVTDKIGGFATAST